MKCFTWEEYFKCSYLIEANHNLNPNSQKAINDSLPLRKSKKMSDKNKKQFGVWMDSHQATIVGRENVDSGEFVVLGHANNAGPEGNSNENTANNHEIMLTQKFFKEIASLMPNVDAIHVSGTGQVQEQFIKFLAETPQYKNAVSTESTSNKMSDENFVAYVDKHFK